MPYILRVHASFHIYIINPFRIEEKFTRQILLEYIVDN